MENDFNSNLTKYELEKEKIFNLDYENQKVDNNKDYEKWKDSMINFYGNDGKLFRCLKDKILFYSGNNGNSAGFVKCPICNNFICTYCSYSSKFDDEDIMCCFKRVIATIFKYRAQKYAEKEFKKNCENTIIIIPGCNFFIIYYIFCVIILCSLPSKESKQKKDKLEIPPIFNSTVFILIFVLMGLLLTIPFFNVNVIFLIFIFLISIPIHFYPIKFFVGIFHNF